MSRTKLNEVIIVTADRTRGLADGLDFDSGDRWQSTGKELILDFTGDGNLVLQTLALVLFFYETADRTRHLIEGFAQLTQLISVLDLHAMRKISGLHILGAAVKIGDRPGNPAREDKPGRERRGFNEKEHDSHENEIDEIGTTKLTERCKNPAVQVRRPRIEHRQHRPEQLHLAITRNISRIEPGHPVHRRIDPKHGTLQRAVARHDAPGHFELCAA